MKRGRKAHPNYLHVVNGNPGRRPRNQAEPLPEVELPVAPATLTAAQRAVWDDIVPSLFKMHPTMTSGAGARRLLVRYCQAVALADMAVAALKKVDDLTALGAQGQPITNPLLTAFHKMANFERLVAAEFGMTPSSRAGIEMPKHPDAHDPTAARKRG